VDIEELELLLKEGEGLTVEFKESFSSKLDKDIVAFTNTHGGRIFLGVNDQGKIVGETLTNDLKAKINSLARNCEPDVVLKSIEQVDKVVVITIDESDEKPHSCSAGYYRRLDAATQKMNQKELKLLFDASSQKPRFEEQINDDISWDDISQSKIKRFLLETKIKLDEVDPNKLLNSLRLARENKINNAGVLFFAGNPRNFLLQCEMILVAFKGTKGVHIYDRVDVQDDLITQFNEAMTFLRKHLNIRSEIKGVNRYDICEIPLEALREAVVNAVIHRDYSMRGTSLMVEVHEDRVVIKNPGGLLPGVSVNALTQISIRRNETIADIFSRIDKAERIGSGIRRIMELMADADLARPIIECNAFFSITFERDPRFKVSGVAIEESKILKDELSVRQEKILNILQNKKLSPREILDTLKEDISDRTLRRELQALKERGYVDSEGQFGPKTKWFAIKPGH
jgi:ATP-dependent DNA helicase RecG